MTDRWCLVMLLCKSKADQTTVLPCTPQKDQKSKLALSQQDSEALMSVSHVVLSFGHVGHVGHDRNKMTLEDLLTPPVLSLEDPKYKALIERCTREAGDGWSGWTLSGS